MFKDLFISNYIENKTTFIPYNYLINSLYPMYRITTDGDLEEDESIDENYIHITYDYDVENVDTYSIYRDTEECMLNEELRENINDILDQLNEREQIVISMRFGIRDDNSVYDLEEIAKYLKVTRERVRQIESSAIKKLKHPKVNKGLKKYVFNIDETIKDNSEFKYISDFWINIIKHYNNYIYSTYEYEIGKNKIIEDFKIERIANDIMNMIAKSIKDKDKIYIDTSDKYNVIFEIFRNNFVFSEMVRKDMVMRINIDNLDLHVNIFIGEKSYELNKDEEVKLL